MEEGKQAYYSAAIPNEKTLEHPDKIARIKSFEEGFKKSSKESSTQKGCAKKSGEKSSQAFAKHCKTLLS